jgi:single-stranded DNA-binding protein
MRCPTEEDSILVSLVAFSDTARRGLSALTKGDALSVVGRAKLTSWEKDGDTKFGISVIAEQVLSVYQLEKRRRAAAPEAGEAPTVRSYERRGTAAEAPDSGGSVAEMADDLPF